MSAVDWTVYAACTTPGCRAYAGEPCVDVRWWPPASYRKPLKKTPHKGRAKV